MASWILEEDDGEQADVDQAEQVVDGLLPGYGEQMPEQPEEQGADGLDPDMTATAFAAWNPY